MVSQVIRYNIIISVEPNKEIEIVNEGNKMKTLGEKGS